MIDPVTIGARAIARFTLHALTLQIASSEQGSEALDVAIMQTFYSREQRHIGATCYPECCPDSRHIDSIWVDPLTDRWVLMGPAFEFSRDIKAALALAERCLPQANWIIGRGRTRPDEPLYGARLLDGTTEIGDGEHKASPAMALLSALMDALTNQGEAA